MKQYYKTIILDFDGTIADSLHAIVTIYQELAQKHNLKPLRKDEINILRTKKPFEILSYLQIPIWKTPFMLYEGRKLFSKLATKIEPFKGVPELLNKLQSHYSLGILTSNNKTTVEQFLKKNNLRMFDFVISEKNVLGKDVALQKIVENNNLEKDKTIYIGDEVRDVMSCNKIEMPVIAVTWGFNEKGILSKSNPTYLVDYPEEILTIL